MATLEDRIDALEEWQEVHIRHHQWIEESRPPLEPFDIEAKRVPQGAGDRRRAKRTEGVGGNDVDR